MAIMLYNPVLPRRSFDRFFSNLWNDQDVEDNGAWASMAYTPNVNIKETAGELVLSVELPGLEKKDVNVTIENGVLTISGERRFVKDDQKENYCLCELNYGTFTRRFRLGNTVDPKKIVAHMDKGILDITLSKVPEAKAHTVEIK